MEALNRELLQFFDKLLWISIQSSVLIILIVLLQKILRERFGIRWHYLLWFLLLIRLAIPWLPESKISIFNLVPKSIQQGRIIETFSELPSTRFMGFFYMMNPQMFRRHNRRKVVLKLSLLDLFVSCLCCGWLEF